jgi:hypothetical protein
MENGGSDVKQWFRPLVVGAVSATLLVFAIAAFKSDSEDWLTLAIGVWCWALSLWVWRYA